MLKSCAPFPSASMQWWLLPWSCYPDTLTCASIRLSVDSSRQGSLLFLSDDLGGDSERLVFHWGDWRCPYFERAWHGKTKRKCKNPVTIAVSHPKALMTQPTVTSSGCMGWTRSKQATRMKRSAMKSTKCQTLCAKDGRNVVDTAAGISCREARSVSVSNETPAWTHLHCNA